MILLQPAKRKFVVCCLYVALLHLHTALAETAGTDGLRGPPFTEPGQGRALVPPGWEDLPIKHDAEARHANLVISLDQQSYPIFQPVIQRYARDKGLHITVISGTCGISAGMLRRKAIDIGGFCCPPGVTDRLPKLRFHTMGIAAIAFLVHPDSKLKNISTAQARQIFQGNIYHWSELRQKPVHRRSLIQPVGRLHCKVRPGHWRLLLDNEDLFGPRLYEVGAIPDMISQVSKNPAAIGYETLWMAKYYSSKGRVKTLQVDHHEPSDGAVLLSGKYPLYRTYNITTWEHEKTANPLAKELVNYLLSQMEQLGPKYNIIPYTDLRAAGWKFIGDELVGEPE